jgi:hypothetical protein
VFRMPAGNLYGSAARSSAAAVRSRILSLDVVQIKLFSRQRFRTIFVCVLQIGRVSIAARRSTPPFAQGAERLPDSLAGFCLTIHGPSHGIQLQPQPPIPQQDPADSPFPPAEASGEALFAGELKTESCRVWRWLAHFGHATLVPLESTSCSYRAPQSSQAYSYMGIWMSLRTRFEPFWTIF